MLARTRPAIDGALRLARELVDGGYQVGLEARSVGDLGPRLRDAGLADSCELTVSAEVADVGALAAELPEARVVVPAAEPGAERRCRAYAGRRVRLADGRGAAADLAFVRCLNVLMAAGGDVAVATTDRRLIALAGERAAWNARTPDTWEHVMPYGVRTMQQRRLLAAGYRVRVVLR